MNAHEIIRPMAETKSIGQREYPVIRHVQSQRFGVVPLVGVPMMTDYEWQKSSLQHRLQYQEVYREVLGEDVETVCDQLRRCLEEHKEEATAWAL